MHCRDFNVDKCIHNDWRALLLGGIADFYG